MRETIRFGHPRWPLLAAGDLAVFLAFAALGRRAHSMGSALDDVVATALPFVVAWGLVAPFTGAFGAGATAGLPAALRRASYTWLLAFPLGLLVRVPLVGHLAHWSFVLVTALFTLAMLLGWRAAAATLVGGRPAEP